ncbi:MULTISPECIES: multidrug ABC transporter ATPase [Solibacillus]|mgnify:FL=1|uniref:Multidrug ABC transporter ATPase n=1 Tax=Solibacillus merdavium TaxID=2762218 RepID=A0ABR8XHP9_9BACL|nr:multidrug ABC transporter ATPase [Solibacillus merdavium]MBD8031438.1 multidrug ABC transporter ATPase [Solibacillus merdavium]
MQNNNRKKNNEAIPENSPVLQAASLEVIAGLLATLSEGISTFATALAIQEAQQLTINNTNNNVEIKSIQEQLNYLTKEVKKISKALNI